MVSTQTQLRESDYVLLNDSRRPADRAGIRVVVVRVPGSRRSPENRGLAVAIDRWLTATFTLDGSRNTVIERNGTLRDLTVAPGNDRLLVAFRAACIRAGRDVPADLRIRVSSDVEVGRGLGASAAAAVAGALGARALLDLPLDDHALISAASTADGSIAQVVASFEATTCVDAGAEGAVT
jgi:mevalonate kinase